MTIKTTAYSSSLLGLVIFGFVGTASPAVEAAPSPGLPVTGAVVNCRAVSPRAMSALQSSLRSAYSAASSDASRNGTKGEYAVAATNSRNLIKRALDRADAMIAWNSTPRSTTGAEAGTVKEYTRTILEVLPQAAHWATISSIYHQSADARRAFDGAVQALDQGRQLFSDAGRCYMDGVKP